MGVRPFSVVFFGVSFFSVVVSLSASHWFLVWVGMEVGVMAALPLIIWSKSYLEVEAGLEYLMVQSFGGMVVYCGMVFSFDLIMCVGLVIKLGSFPFYHWLPQLCGKLGWFAIGLLLVWQKVAPLFMLGVFSGSEGYASFILCSGVGSVVAGSVGGMVQSDYRSLMGYSSLVHLGWMLGGSMVSMELVWFYLFVYFLNLYVVFYIMDCEGLCSFNSLGGFKVSLLAGVGVLSIWGFPPLLGFGPKLLLSLALWGGGYGWYLCVLLLGSWISLGYYCSFIWGVFSGGVGVVKFEDMIGVWHYYSVVFCIVIVVSGPVFFSLV